MNPALHPTRSISLILLAALAGAALWLLAPWERGGGGGSSSGNDGASAGLPSMLKVNGDIQVETQGDVVTKLVLPVIVRGNESIDLSGASLRAETALAATALAVVPATYTLDWQFGNGDELLDPGEQLYVTVELPERSSIHPDNPLRLVFTVDAGPALVLEDVLAQ
jgi:hypothetical protein